MDFRQLMGSMASGIGSGIMDKDMAHAYNGAQSGFTDPLQAKKVKDLWATRNNLMNMDKNRKEQAGLKSDRFRRMRPEPADNYGGEQL